MTGEAVGILGLMSSITVVGLFALDFLSVVATAVVLGVVCITQSIFLLTGSGR